ncbi:MAG: transposase, partial [Bacteroidota bacterium]|nr:transposase [Bacteroidota bacterium]
DHIHILLGLNPNMSISDLVRDIKRSSSLYINSNKLINKRFTWQDGYCAFSYGKSQIPMIYNYIENQKQHHQKTSFKKEYLSFLERFEIKFEDNFLFEFYE